MSQNRDRYYRIATWLSLAELIVSTALSLPEFIAMMSISSEFLRVIMIGVVTGIIITLLISMKYPWMKWVMLILTAFRAFSMIDVQAFLSQNWITVLNSFLSVGTGIAITILLFKANPKVRQLQEVKDIPQA